MKRRNFLTAGLLGGASLATPALSQGASRTLKMASPLSSAKSLAERISSLSAGRLTVELTEHDPVSIQDALDGEAYDLSYVSTTAWERLDPSFAVFGTVPGGMTTDEIEGWMQVSDGQQVLDAVAKKHGVKSFLAGSIGPSPLFSKAPLNMDALFDGKTVAARGYLVKEVLKAMGASTVNDIDHGTNLNEADIVAGLPLQEAVQTGVVKTHPVMTTPGALVPAQMKLVSIALNTWESMDENTHALLTSAIEAHHVNTRLEGIVSRASAYAEHASQLDVQELSDAAMTEIGQASNDALLAFLDLNTEAADAADAYIFAYADMVQWSTIGPASYAIGRKKGL